MAKVPSSSSSTSSSHHHQQFKKLLQDNWNLKFKLNQVEMGCIALRTQNRFLGDNVRFLSEKIRLEDVLSSVLKRMARQAMDQTQNDDKIEELGERVEILKQETEAALELTRQIKADISSLHTLMLEIT